MKFHFRLETLLNWKKGLEEQSRIILIRKIEELKRREEKIQYMIKKRINQYKKFEERLKEGIESHEYLIYQQFSEKSYEDLSEQIRSKNDQEYEIEQERENLIEMTKEKKILERLKEKRLMRFNYHQEKNEQKLLDELVLRKHAPK